MPGRSKKNGKTLEPLYKSVPAPWSLAYKKRAESAVRVKYPLKRVDWDPRGSRNPADRAESKYVWISWDEAANLVGEIKWICKEYGLLAYPGTG